MSEYKNLSIITFSLVDTMVESQFKSKFFETAFYHGWKLFSESHKDTTLQR